MHIRTANHQNALLSRAFSFNGVTGAARHAAFISARASRSCGSSALLRAVCEAPQAGGGYAGTTRLPRARDPRKARLGRVTRADLLSISAGLRVDPRSPAPARPAFVKTRCFGPTGHNDGQRDDEAGLAAGEKEDASELRGLGLLSGEQGCGNGVQFE
jgi:hypothetical protein